MKRVISLVLSFVIVLGTFIVAIPPITVNAALTIPEVLTLEPEINGTTVTMIGKLTKNGGADIIEYGFSYQINGGSAQTIRKTNGLNKEEEFSYPITLNPGDYGYYYFYAKNSEGKSKVSGVPFAVEEKKEVADTNKPMINPITASPANSAEYGTKVKFSTKASDNIELQTLELLIDGIVEETVTSFGTSDSISYSTKNLSVGSHTVTVIATDAAGNVNQTSITYTIIGEVADTNKPMINPITASPANSAEYGTTVEFFTKASDNTELQTLELLIDGIVEETVTSSGTSDSISYSTKNLSVGSHTVTVIATDAAGNVNQTSITYTITGEVVDTGTTTPDVNIPETETPDFDDPSIILPNPDPELPKVTTGAPVIDGNKITLSGMVDHNGWTTITEYGFSYTIDGKSEHKKITGFVVFGEEVTHTITVPAGASGEYTFYAKNSVGKTSGEWRGFSVPATSDTTAPEINEPSIEECTHPTTAQTAVKEEIKYVSNRNSRQHEYYIVSDMKCNLCGVDLGQKKSETLTDAHRLNASGVCLCGYQNSSEEDTTDRGSVNRSEIPFTDVKTTDPYYNAIVYCYKNGIFNGTSTTTFEPYENMNRAMVVTVLANIAGVDTNSYQGTDFSDVKATDWYAPYIKWASQNKYVNGYSDGRFGPDDFITVEQAIQILFNYSNDTSEQSYPLGSAFKDAHNISDWAYTAMQWAVSNDIYKGATPGRLHPQGKVSRAMMAHLLYKADFEIHDDNFYLTNGVSNASYCIEYQGKEYPIILPSYTIDNESNFDYNDDGFITVYEKFFTTADFNIPKFFGELELDDAGIVASGIGLTQQYLSNWNVDKMGIILQESPYDSSVCRAVILIGNSTVYTRGYAENNVILSTINPDGLKGVNSYIRKIYPSTLPTAHLDNDHEYLYDIIIKYSTQWLGETFSNYLIFDKYGNAEIVERIMADDDYDLVAYYNGTIKDKVENLSPFRNPEITQSIKMESLVPRIYDASGLINELNKSKEIKIKKTRE